MQIMHGAMEHCLCVATITKHIQSSVALPMATGRLGTVTYVLFPTYTKVKVPHFRTDG